MNGLSALMVSHLRHGASVDEADVCLFAFLRLSYAKLRKHLAERRCFRKVKLAAQRVVGSLLILKN